MRFWRDIPGQLSTKREVISLGICRSLTAAQRKADEKLLQLGINSAQQFSEATSTTTFRHQGEWWLKSLQQRKRNPVEQTTIDNRGYALDKWIYPFLGNCTLGEVNNRTVKELVEKLKVEPREYQLFTPSEEVQTKISEFLKDRLGETIRNENKQMRHEALVGDQKYSQTRAREKAKAKVANYGGCAGRAGLATGNGRWV